MITNQIQLTDLVCNSGSKRENNLICFCKSYKFGCFGYVKNVQQWVQKLSNKCVMTEQKGHIWNVWFMVTTRGAKLCLGLKNSQIQVVWRYFNLPFPNTASTAWTTICPANSLVWLGDVHQLFRADSWKLCNIVETNNLGYRWIPLYGKWHPVITSIGFSDWFVAVDMANAFILQNIFFFMKI